jgi:transposase
VAERFRFVLAVVLRPKESRRFVLVPRRWVVERTFGWLNLLTPPQQGLRTLDADQRNLGLSGNDQTDG